MIEDISGNPDDVLDQVFLSIRFLQNYYHGEAVKAGWHNNLQTGKPFTYEEQDAKFPARIALTHSELSEALEAHRSDKMDDKLVHRSGAEVELVDALIRIFDLAGAMGYDLAGAGVEKAEFNAKRADHKPENRKKSGGKKY